MNRTFALRILVATSALVAPLAAAAAPITVPTGLNPGDSYRLTFVTSTTRDATSSNIADYNSFVTNVANSVPELAALGTTWKAIASTPTIAARDNTGTNPSANGVPVYELADHLIASTNADLWDGAILHPIDRSEQGYPFFNILVWTGSDAFGLGSPGRELGVPFVALILGKNSFATTTSWMFAASNGGLDQRPLYAMSGVLTVPSVPEPGTLTLAGLASAGLVLSSLRRLRPRGTKTL
jgi:hypothetical protein